MPADITRETSILDVREQIARIDDWMCEIHAMARAPRLSPMQIVGVVAVGAVALFAVGAMFAKLVVG
jgi:hypothetical protein